jgi:hypothetical protein
VLADPSIGPGLGVQRGRGPGEAAAPGWPTREAVRHWEHAAAAADARAADRTGALLELADARRRGPGPGRGGLPPCRRWPGGQTLIPADPARIGPVRAGPRRHWPGPRSACTPSTRTWWPPDQVVALLSGRSTRSDRDPDGEPLRLHVMASLSRALAWHGLDLPRARTLAAEAGRPRAGGDPTTMAACCWAQHHAVWAPAPRPNGCGSPPSGGSGRARPPMTRSCSRPGCWRRPIASKAGRPRVPR